MSPELRPVPLELVAAMLRGTTEVERVPFRCIGDDACRVIRFDGVGKKSRACSKGPPVPRV